MPPIKRHQNEGFCLRSLLRDRSEGRPSPAIVSDGGGAPSPPPPWGSLAPARIGCQGQGPTLSGSRSHVGRQGPSAPHAHFKLVIPSPMLLTPQPSRDQILLTARVSDPPRGHWLRPIWFVGSQRCGLGTPQVGPQARQPDPGRAKGEKRSSKGAGW